MNPRPELVLVRHGESFGNLTGDYSTSRHDNLTDTGWAQARTLAAHWRRPFDRWAASPLGRTRQTALPTLERFGVTAELWPDLAECCWQEPRHLPPSDPELPLVPLGLEAHEERWFGPAHLAAVAPEHERWQDGLRRMRRAAAALDAVVRGGQSILAVSHGYAISKLVILLTGEGDVNEVFDMVNTGVTRLVPTEPGRYTIEEFNRRP
jgi:broad specificity phosphatase PhoE